MGKSRLEAFSDGVLAIIITIMVFELKAPTSSSLYALKGLGSTALTYVLSFLHIAIYWNNHHHMLHTANRINGAVLWANMHLLFWMSLIPTTTNWLDKTHFAASPTRVYGVNLALCGFAYHILQRAIIRSQGENSALARAVGDDLKGKQSLGGYLLAVALS
jgi:uncharacterized membrane protein